MPIIRDSWPPRQTNAHEGTHVIEVGRSHSVGIALDLCHFPSFFMKITIQLPQIIIIIIIAAFKEPWLRIPSVGVQRDVVALLPSPTTVRMWWRTQPCWAVARCDVRLETKDSKMVTNEFYCFTHQSTNTYQTHSCSDDFKYKTISLF